MRSILKKILWLAAIVFVAINALAFIHAYKFTHFSGTQNERTRDPKSLSPLVKTKVILGGIDNPKPMRVATPTHSFKTISIKSDVQLEAWHITVADAIGTVILFHGYSGEKSQLISRAEHFSKLGFNTLLVDFMGSGGSEGDGTTIGFAEAREVRDCFEYIKGTGESNIHLFGTSMGAAAILKALDDWYIAPKSIILECPFGSLYKTVSARFDIMGVPSFPMAAVLTFWGGFQQGYWAFSHNPEEYAKSVKVPTLLLFGEKDDRVSMEETQNIFANIQGEKQLITYPDQGHDVYLNNEQRWRQDTENFISRFE